jgi:hypothetical protein
MRETPSTRYDQVRPGGDGEPLPAATLVFRIGKGVDLNPEALEKRVALEIFFKPSSVDQESPGQRLSVWVEELTLPDQAWDFTGRDPEKAVVACLNVDDIRAVVPPEPFNPLGVEWEEARLGDGSVNTRPGSEGHAGISGLLQGGNGKRDKYRRKALRTQLADKASISPVRVPHDIPEEHIRVAAYFIYKSRGARNGSQETDWIDAIRQLRRERVRQQRQESPASYSFGDGVKASRPDSDSIG